MSYNPLYEASKALPVEHIAEKLETFAAGGQDLSRRRFSRSPPSVPSCPSTTWEDSESEPPSPNAQLGEQEWKDMQHSSASAQYPIQIQDELRRMRAARDKGLLQQPELFEVREAAEANVRYRWMQQGIWDERWTHSLVKIWKHELQQSPLPVEPAGPSQPSPPLQPLPYGPKRKYLPSEQEKVNRKIARRAVELQNEQSSRPCYQFVYQFVQEREWIKMGLTNVDKDQDVDLDTRAYENVKARWVRDRIWDNDWTLLPGTSWKHERPQKYPSKLELFRKANERKAAAMEQAERPPRWYSMQPIFEDPPPPLLVTTPSPADSPDSHRASSDLVNPDKSATITEPTNRSKTSRNGEPLHVPRSTRTSTIKHKPSTKAPPPKQPHVQSAKKKPSKTFSESKSSKRANPKPKVNASASRTAKNQPAKDRNSLSKENNTTPMPANKEIPKPMNAIHSRPRRAAASKAMQNFKR